MNRCIWAKEAFRWSYLLIKLRRSDNSSLYAVESISDAISSSVRGKSLDSGHFGSVSEGI
jgi:hypothetical protein